MATNLVVNGVSYAYPNTGDQQWGSAASGWALAVTNGMLQKAGGTFTLTADVNFGASYGLLSAYFSTRTALPSTAGTIRLAKTESIGWRNNANGGNNTLATDTSDQLLYNGVVLAGATGVVPTTSGGTGLTSYTTGDTLYASAANVLSKLAIGTANKVKISNGTIPSWALLVNANIDAAAAIAYSKLALTGAILNADLAGSIAYSKLSLTGAILNADLAGSIAYSKLSLTGAILNADLAGSIAYSKLSLTGAILNADLAGSIAASKLVGSDIATVGTVTTGTWSATTIAVNKGGTGLTSYTAGDLLYASGTTTIAKLAVGSAFQFLGVTSSLPAYQTLGPLSFRNAILNGNFDFWQEGTSFAAAANGQYLCDQWNYAKVGAVVHTLSRSTNVPTLAQSGFQSLYSGLLTVTTADASIAAGDLCAIQHPIEGPDWGAIKGQAVTLDFWVYATVTGTNCIFIKNNGDDRSYVAEYTVSSSNTWEHKTISLTLNPSGGTDSYAEGTRGALVGFTLSCGSTFQTTAAAWQTGNFLGTSNQVNQTATIGNVFQVSQVQLYLGSASRGFCRQSDSYALELQACQRFYSKSYDTDVAPGTVSEPGKTSTTVSGTTAILNLRYPVTMCKIPTVTSYSNGTGASGQLRNDSTAADTAATNNAIGRSKYVPTGSCATTNIVSAHFVAIARIV